MKLTNYEFDVLNLIAHDDFILDSEFPYEGETYLSGIAMDIKEHLEKSGHSISGIVSSLVKKEYVTTNLKDDLIGMTKSGYEAYIEMLSKIKEEVSE